MEMNWKFLNSRGQSSITDAMYFLIIVMALSSLMFFFSSGYGVSINKYLSQQYKSDYVTSALETLLYSSAERDPVNDTLKSSFEVDNFFAALKEEHYAGNGIIGESVKKVFLKRVRSIMHPVVGSFDYMVYIFVPPYFFETYDDVTSGEGTVQSSNVILLLLKKTDVVKYKEDCGKNSGSCANINYSEYVHYYFCRPFNFQSTVSGLLPLLGEIAKPTENRIILPLADEAVRAQANILMWLPTSFPKAMESGPIPELGELKCTVVPAGWLT